MIIVLHCLFLFIMVFLIELSSYIKKTQPTAEIDQLIFSCCYGVKKTDIAPIIAGIKDCLPSYIILYALSLFIFYFNKGPIFEHIHIHYIRYSTILFFIVILICMINFKVFSYIKSKITSSKFIEENYINPKDVNVTFKEKKKNLIYIILESFESTLTTKENGGSYKEDIIPYMSELFKDNDSTIFYTNNDKEGMKMVQGAHYTTSALFADNNAIPFKYNFYDKRLSSKNFFNNSYSLGDLLHDNGYINELISAANASFGAIKEMCEHHGNYNVIDDDNLNKFGFKLTEKDKSSWGFNDKYLYEIAKKRLTELSKNDKPFNLTLVSIDTHFPYGYNGDYTIKKYNDTLIDSYLTESKLVYDFINWIKKQDFYKDTTIVIMGDHLSMQNDRFEGIDFSNRNIYNCYINSSVKPINNKNRLYSALDTYPSILASLGATIKGNKIGLGTNIFSDEQTLLEKYGIEYVNKELIKKSKFIDKKIKK